MIGMRTILEVADNSGARRLQAILPRGGDKASRRARRHCHSIGEGSRSGFQHQKARL